MAFTPASFPETPPSQKSIDPAPGQHLHRPSHWSRSGTTPTSASWTWCESAPGRYRREGMLLPVIGLLPRAFIPFCCLLPTTQNSGCLSESCAGGKQRVFSCVFSLIHTRCSARWHIVPDWFCTMFFKFKFMSSFFHICDNWFSIFSGYIHIQELQVCDKHLSWFSPTSFLSHQHTVLRKMKIFHNFQAYRLQIQFWPSIFGITVNESFQEGIPIPKIESACFARRFHHFEENATVS